MMPAAPLFRTLAGTAALLLAAAAPGLAQHPAQAERPGDHAIGDPDAPLLVVEYASFACPHCAHFQEEAWPTIREDFIETGQVRWIFRPMLTNPVALAGAGVIVAECAAEDRFFDAADLLFSEQPTLFETARSGGDVLAVYNRVGEAVGVSPEALMACFQDPAMNAAVNDAAMQASEDGIPGTPAFVIHDQVLMAVGGPEGTHFEYGDAPLMINGERVPGELDGDSFNRIILHFLDQSDSGN